MTVRRIRRAFFHVYVFLPIVLGSIYFHLIIVLIIVRLGSRCRSEGSLPLWNRGRLCFDITVCLDRLLVGHRCLSLSLDVSWLLRLVVTELRLLGLTG